MKKNLAILLLIVILSSLGIFFACSKSNSNGQQINPPNNSSEENLSDNTQIKDDESVTIDYAHLEMGTEILNLKTYSNDVEQTGGEFENGGKVSINDKGIFIDRISEKDKITFDWVIVNKSNIDIKYKPYINLPYGNELTDNLTVKINGGSLEEFSKRQWKFVKYDSQNKNVETIKIEIELPELEYPMEIEGSTGQIEITTKVIQGNLDAYNDVKVTPENLATIDFTQDETQYEFYGTFTNPIIKAFGTKNLKQIYDGSNAIINGQLKVYLQKEIANFNELFSEGAIKEKDGEYTIRNFKYVTDSISIIANSTKVRIENNNCAAMDMAAPNCEIDVINNAINSLSQKHQRFDGEQSSYGFYYYNALNYICRFDSNTVSNTLGHGVVFHGNFGVLTNYNWDTVDRYGLENNIASFQKNEIIAASGKACLKFWDDHQFCANQAYNNEAHVWDNAALDKPEEDMIVFIKNQNNTFHLSNTY